jgi:hypothetical protein
MPTGKIIDPKLFQPGVTVRMVKARRYGVIESVNHEKGTAIVAWYEADPNDANSLTPNNTKISGKPTSLRYLITHSGPIPAPRVSMFLQDNMGGAEFIQRLFCNFLTVNKLALATPAVHLLRVCIKRVVSVSNVVPLLSQRTRRRSAHGTRPLART